MSENWGYILSMMFPDELAAYGSYTVEEFPRSLRRKIQRFDGSSNSHASIICTLAAFHKCRERMKKHLYF